MCLLFYGKKLNRHFGQLNKYATYQKLWNMAKPALRRKFIVVNAYIRRRKNIKSIF